MTGLDFDMVTALLACAGEATLCYAMMMDGDSIIRAIHIMGGYKC